MKDRLTGKEKEKLEREEWMTELPPLLQVLHNLEKKLSIDEHTRFFHWSQHIEDFENTSHVSAISIVHCSRCMDLNFSRELWTHFPVL